MEQDPATLYMIDADGCLPIHCACSGSASLESIKFLVEKGVLVHWVPGTSDVLCHCILLWSINHLWRVSNISSLCTHSQFQRNWTMVDCPSCWPLILGHRRVSCSISWGVTLKLCLRWSLTLYKEPNWITELHHSFYHKLAWSVCVCVCEREREREK